MSTTVSRMFSTAKVITPYGSVIANSDPRCIGPARPPNMPMCCVSGAKLPPMTPSIVGCSSAVTIVTSTVMKASHATTHTKVAIATVKYLCLIQNTNILVWPNQLLAKLLVTGNVVATIVGKSAFIDMRSGTNISSCNMPSMPVKREKSKKDSDAEEGVMLRRTITDLISF